MRKSVLLGLGLLFLVLAPATGGAEISDELAEELRGHVESHVEADDLETKRAAFLTWGLFAGEQDHETLAEYKTSDEFGVRLAAGLALHLAGVDDAKSFVLDQLTGKSELYPILRDQIGVLPDEVEREILEGLLAKGDAPHQRAVFRYVSGQQGALYDLLSEHVTSGDEDVRNLALEALRRTARAEALDVAESELIDSSDSGLQEAGLELAIEISRVPGRTRRAIEVLQGAVDHDDAEIAQRAAVRLLEMHDKSGVDRLIGLLEELEETERRTEIAAILLEHEVAPPTQKIASLREKVDDETLGQKLLELQIASGDEEAFEKVVEMFDTTKFEKRLEAAKAMGRSDDERAVELLGEALFEGNPKMRRSAARSLRQIADEGSLETLERSISKEQNEEVKIEVIRALGVIGTKKALRILRFNSRTRRPAIKEAIIAAVRDAGKKKGAETLSMFFGSRDLSMQWKAFVAALEVAPEVAMDRVDQAFRNPPENFMEDIEELSSDRHERLLKVLLVHENDRVRRSAIRSARRIGEPFHEVFRKLALDVEAPKSTRVAAIRTLGAARHEDDVGLFEKLVSQEEDDSEIGRLAAWTLTEYESEALEATFRGYLARSDESPGLSAIGAYGLARIHG